MTHDPHARGPELLHVPRHRPDPLARQPVERPDQQHVELAPMRAGEDGGERRPVAPRPAGGVGVDLHGLEPEAIRPLAELALLALGRLFLGADAQVEGGAGRAVQSSLLLHGALNLMLLEITICGHMLLAPVLTEERKQTTFVGTAEIEIHEPLHVESTSAPTLMHVSMLAPPWMQPPRL